ncbi:penicillin-binding transpeptidase domain-containing protein [Kitasatospora sp. NBC_01302]|uniref:penicillin-binding transpeptidase domain-containing protein n=1 Tax=Kitasatospora sp. NBC_01302 TaxID=2903575 RepID=UPI002E0FEBF9|nr:penicillin-binding transpeptidase domain-containing protein [Kitasatospora sp. NBC_01302]
MRQGAKTAIVSAIAAAMLGAGGYGAYSLVGSDSKKSASPAAPKPRTVVAESPSPDLAANGAKAFLAAWASGDLQGASKLTDDPASALAALTAFQQQVKPSAITLTPGVPTTPAAFASATAQPSGAAAKPSPSASAGASGSPSPSASAAPASQVLLTFKSHVEFANTSNTWDYTGYLGMVKMSDGTAAVDWAPTVINPHLGPGQQIVTQPVYNPPTRVTDRNGQSLQNSPSLTQILANFQTNPPAQNPADAGTGVAIVDPAGKTKPQPLFTVIDPKPGQPIKLTIDANLQAAAQKAADEQYAKDPSHKAGVVAIEPSTGNVLAVANSPATGFNMALQGQTAPGSTMKVITASALLEAGVDPNATMPCPLSYGSGTIYHNDANFKADEPNNTFMQDFTISCNTAFIKQSMASLKSGQLNKQASDVFGIGQNWKIGFPTFDGSVPGAGQSTDETEGEYFGQGKDLMNPLTMASVAATVESGTFKQPVLVAGMPQLPAARQLSPDTLTKLRSMMNSVMTNPSGTAYNALQGVSGNIGGKTGTAETSSDPKAATNSWFTGYRDNLAVSVEVINGGFGADAAVPAAAEVLKVGNGS